MDLPGRPTEEVWGKDERCEAVVSLTFAGQSFRLAFPLLRAQWCLESQCCSGCIRCGWCPPKIPDRRLIQRLVCDGSRSAIDICEDFSIGGIDLARFKSTSGNTSCGTLVVSDCKEGRGKSDIANRLCPWPWIDKKVENNRSFHRKYSITIASDPWILWIKF